MTCKPAFPKGDDQDGMTLREYAAIHALQGLLATNPDLREWEVADMAIKHADELIKRLERR